MRIKKILLVFVLISIQICGLPFFYLNFYVHVRLINHITAWHKNKLAITFHPTHPHIIFLFTGKQWNYTHIFLLSLFVTFVVFSEGARVAQSTTIDTLLRYKNFQLVLNDQKYLLVPPKIGKLTKWAIIYVF